MLKLNRPLTMSIAGFDPSGGAGILADCKVFEQLKTYGTGVISANTIQNSEKVFAVSWNKPQEILQQISVVLNELPVTHFKIGIIENSSVLISIVEAIRKHNRKAFIIWDPILHSSSGYTFFETQHQLEILLEKINLITPNLPEFEKLFTDKKNALSYSKKTSIYLKGGHNTLSKGEDCLLHKGEAITFSSGVNFAYPKHGSGCIFSSALTAHLAHGKEIKTACTLAKQYIEKALNSNETLLAYHN